MLLGAVAFGQIFNRWQVNQQRVAAAAIPALFEFAPSSGAGLPSNADLCDVADSGDLAGEWHCLKGDGGVATGSAVMTNVGPMATQTWPGCPNGLDCSDVVRLNDDSAASYFTHASTTAPTGDFTNCTIYTGDPGISGSAIASKYNGGLGGAYDVEVVGTTAYYFYVTGAATPFTTTTVALGTENLYCATYTHGTTTGQPYTNATANSAVTVTGGIDATARVHAVNAYSTGGGKNLGRYRGSFFTEKVLSANDVTRLYATTINQPITTPDGGTITFTRASVSSCNKSDDTGGQLLRSGQPCFTNGGLRVGRLTVNPLLRSDAIANAAWSDVGTPAAVSRAFTSTFGHTSLGSITDNDAAAFEGRSQTVTAAIANKITFSCWLRSSTATSARMTIVGTGASEGDQTCDFTGLTSTPKRKVCTSATAYGAGMTALTFSVLVGTTVADTGVIGVGDCQEETGAVTKPYVRTDGTSASVAAESATTTLDVGGGIKHFKAVYYGPQAFASNGTNHRVLTAKVDASNYFQAIVDSSGVLTCLWQIGGVAKSGASTATLTANGAANTVECKYDGADISACVGGSCATTSVAFTPFTGSATVYLGGSDTAGEEINGVIKNVCLHAVSGGCP